MAGRSKAPEKRRRTTPEGPLPGPDLLRHWGRCLRQAREARGMSRQELSRLAGLSLRFLAAIEAGEGNVSVLRLRDLLAALGMGWDELLSSAGFAVDAAPAEKSTARRAIDRILAGRQPGELDEIQRWLTQRFDGAAAKPVALLGLRGAGKTSVGRRLSRSLGLEFAELDELVEGAAGLELQQIFELQGAERYRELEKAALERYLRRNRSGILATGGGIVTQPETYALLRRRCLTVWLRATAEEHWERVVRQGDRRPMQGKPAAMQELRALLAAREPLYEQAQILHDTRGRTLAQVTRGLESTLRERGVGANGQSGRGKRARTSSEF